jgi:CheY-like chemotaxis protein
MPDPNRPARILVVEDEYLLAEDLAETLAGLGVHVLGPVGALDEALELLEALLTTDGGIDGAVLDVNLRGQLVFPLADALIARQVPYVFATGYGPEVLPERYRAAPLLQKPIQPRLLLSLLIGERVLQ